MHAHKTFLSLTAAALCAAAVVPAAASAGSDYERGGYGGKTNQPASRRRARRTPARSRSRSASSAIRRA